MGLMHQAFAARYPAAEAQAKHYDEADRIADEALRRRRADRIDPPPVVSRADKIVAEGDAKRVAYRNNHPGADAAMVFGAQVGYLHGEIKRLCNELACYEAIRTPGLDYLDVETSIGTVVVGYGYLPSEDIEPGLIAPSQVEVCEVWVNGVDLYAWVPDIEAKALLFRARARVQVVDDEALLIARLKQAPRPERQ